MGIVVASGSLYGVMVAHIAHMVTSTSVVVMTKMGNTVPRAGLEPTFLAFLAWSLNLPCVYIRVRPLTVCM